ncbi:MAG: FAD binding domain-containing protein [Ignavibacteriota bacterium]
MNPFQYRRAQDAAGAVRSATPRSKFLAGGTNLIDLMKNGVEKPDSLIDLNRVALAAIEFAAPMAECGWAHWHGTAIPPIIRWSGSDIPWYRRAILSGASPQLRNLATNGGNLLQRDPVPVFHGSRLFAM